MAVTDPFSGHYVHRKICEGGVHVTLMVEARLASRGMEPCAANGIDQNEPGLSLVMPA